MIKKQNLFWVVLFAVVLLLPFSFKNQVKAASNTIRNGIYIDDIDVSGMTKEEAAQAIEDKVNGYLDCTLHFKIATVFTSATMEELGLSWKNTDVVEQAANLGKTGNIVNRYKVIKDLEKEPVKLKLIYQADQDKISQIVNDRCVALNQDPVNATLTRENGEFNIISGEDGRTVNVEESISIIEQFVETEWNGGDSSVELSVQTKEPDAKEDELMKVQNVLGQGSTDYSFSSSARATNIQTASSKINGKVIYPGESFSVTEAVTPFDEENGYEKAPSYENGSVVDTYGGGICQVSTTLYLAVLRAELQVDERHNHSMIVNYVKPSMDAAIAEGSKDFVFTNNTQAPIYLESYASGGDLGFVIYGQEYRDRDNRSVEFESVTTSTTEPDTQLTASSDPLGTVTQTQNAHTGSTAELWKIVTENGESTREQVNSSTYNMTPNIYTVGVTSSDADLTNRMYAAIESNDLNKVYEVANGG